MTKVSVREIVYQYYQAWARGEKDQVRKLLADKLNFRSPQDVFISADDFLKLCWRYSVGLSAVRFVKALYAESEAFVILEWDNDDGSSFARAEYLSVFDGKIQEILVVNNSPSFRNLLDQKLP